MTGTEIGLLVAEDAVREMVLLRIVGVETVVSCAPLAQTVTLEGADTEVSKGFIVSQSQAPLQTCVSGVKLRPAGLLPTESD